MSKKCAARIHFWSHERNVETWTGWQALRSADLKVFGCFIDFLQTATQTYLEDQSGTSYSKAWNTPSFFGTAVFLPSQAELEDCPIHHIPLAVHVSMNPARSVPEGAFAGVPRLQHASVESGIRFIEAEAWQNCRQLCIVKLPATVVGISDNVFRDCKLLNSVVAPGCQDFGYKAFAECCSLQWVYASEGIANVSGVEDALSVQFIKLKLRSAPPGCLNWSTTLFIFTNAICGFWMVIS